MKTDEANILAYIKGELSDEATKAYDSLMHSSPEFRQAVEQIKALYDLSDNLMKQKEVDSSSAWNKVSRRIKRATLREKAWNYTRTAAAILLPFFLLHQFLVQPLLERTPAEMITLSSAPGMVTKVVLPDGSEVWLNAQSELTYPVRFTENERIVELSGEAYFKVTSDSKNRFSVVIPGNTTVSAFGTEFNIDSYPDELIHHVTLAEGNIEVGTAHSMKQTLLVGQKAVLSRSTGEMSVVETDTYEDTAWKDGKMVFRREKLETIAQKLSRKFGVEIILEGEELNSYEYTATFTDESLEDILELLKRSAPVTYSISRQEQLENNTFSQRIVTIRNQ